MPFRRDVGQNGRALFHITNPSSAKFPLCTNTQWGSFSFVAKEEQGLILLTFTWGKNCACSQVTNKWAVEIKEVRSQEVGESMQKYTESSREGFECKTDDKANAYLYSTMLLETCAIIIFSEHFKFFQLQWKWNVIECLMLTVLKLIIYIYIQRLYVKLSVSCY